MLRIASLAPLLLAASAAAQVTGTFALDKSTFAPGEPVFLTFTLHNTGSQPATVGHADPYSFCSGYDIHVHRIGESIPKCLRAFAGSCMGGELTLAPHTSHTERTLLNALSLGNGEAPRDLSHPGSYTVDAIQRVGSIYRPLNNHDTLPVLPEEIHQVLTFSVDPTLEVSPQVFRPFVPQLQSDDMQSRSEAARILATFAPPSLTSTLFTFPAAKDPLIRQFAPMALYNLHTPASISALGQMLLDSPPGSYEFYQSARYLGQLHDPAWLPALLAIADRDPNYLRNAAEAGGESAIPALLKRIDSSSPDLRLDAIDALGETGARASVPLLIGLLNQSDPASSVTISASAALSVLTHRTTPLDDNTHTIAPDAQRRWQAWWRDNASTAPIYYPNDCGSFTPIP